MGLSLLVGKYVSQMKNVTFSADVKGISHTDVTYNDWSLTTGKVNLTNTSGYALGYCSVMGYYKDTAISKTSSTHSWSHAYAPVLAIISATSSVIPIAIFENRSYQFYLDFILSSSGCQIGCRYQPLNEYRTDITSMATSEYSKINCQLLLIK